MTGLRSLDLPPQCRKKAPRLVLGLAAGAAADIEAHFRNMGWDVTRAGSAEEAAQLAYRGRATAVVLPVDSTIESGLLVCAKLKVARPGTRVVLVGPTDNRLSRFARYAGAVGYLPADAGAAAVARAVMGS